MSETTMNRVEEFRQSALAEMRAGDVEAALALFDAALELAGDDTTRELITINKADAMIAIERPGPEVQALPTIVMRRRNLRHVYLASYALVFKFRTENELKRATFYGQLALQSAEESGEPFWKIGALNELGVVYEMDSQFAKAIECFEAATALLKLTDAPEQSRVALQTNLAYNKLLVGETEVGISLMHEVIDRIADTSAKADALIELCYGYVDLARYDEARGFGAAALAIATDPRQIRNAHYLIGEAAYKSGDVEAAEHHFDELAKFYPEFRNLKSLLFAIDLRSMVNLKL